MFTVRFLTIFAIAVLGSLLLSRAGRPARVALPVKRTPNLRAKQIAVPAMHPGDFWFNTACRVVWGLMLAGLSLFGAIATL